MKTLKHLFTALLLMVATVAMAHDFEVGGIYYNILSEEEKTVEVTYRGYSYSSYPNEYTGSVDIPSMVTYNDLTYSVTRIGGSAFEACTGLTSVTIPNSVTSIGYSAFDGCTGLTSITIPNSVTSIGDYAFQYCSGLTHVTIPNSVTSIGDYAFDGCTNLRVVINCSNLRLSRGSKGYGYVAYYADKVINVQNCLIDGNFIFGTINGVNTLVGYCGDDTKLTLPADYKGGNYAICDYAFSGCTNLTSVTIPNSVTSIGDYAFYGCSGLTSVEIPNSVTSIGSSAFFLCTGLTNIVVDEGSSAYDSRDNCNAIIETVTNKLIIGCRNTVIPNSVTSIGDSAFKGCTGLTCIIIPPSVTSIGYAAFDECTNLKELCIEDGGETLYLRYNSTNEGLFYDCPLETLYLGRDLSYNTSSSYGNSPFYNIKTLKSVTIGNSVTSIGDYAFYKCYGLTSVTIGNGVTSIGSYVFTDCSNLEKAIWLTNTPPTGYKNVGATINYVANDQYSGLSNVKVYPYLSSLFEVGGVKYVPVSPAERTCDVIDCVYDSTAVDINIEKTVLFKGIAMNVKQVMPYTFYANKNIKTIKVDNDGIVGNSAFCDCSALSSATISNNGSVGDYAFNSCTSLATATISNNGGIGDYAFSDCSSLVTATLGDSITTIGASAFNGCSKLSEIVIPDAVTAIGSSAFRYCTSLETVKVGNATKSINSYAFGGCSALSSITLGDSVATIGIDAFYSCSSLPEIVIPQSVTKIYSSAFDNCTALADVVIEDRTTALSLGSNGSSPLFSDCPLDSVYIGGKITYSTSSSYGYSPFYRNTSLRSVVITDTEEEVYDNEFYGCSNLKNVSIGNGVKKIGNWAFSGCSALDYFAFGKSVQSIGDEAFSDCNNVTQIISRAKTPPTCGAQALDDINKWNCTLWVPEKYKAEYQSAEQWKEFFFVEGIAAQTYTVTFIVDGEVYDTLSVEYGEKITLPDTPVKEGHTFSGWSEAPEIMPAEDITITGTFTVNTYVVTYIVDGIVYVTDSIAYGEEIVPRDEPTKEGHTFSGWSEAPETMPAEDIVIEGSFYVNSYTITYKVDGEVYATDSIAYGSEIVLRDEPTKEGHTFSGWSGVPEIMPAEDIVIEGSFSVNSYTITYKVDGEVYATDSIAYGSEIVLRDEPTKEGHTFSGWSEAPETMPAEDIVIEGSFSVNSYTITYKVDGEVYATDSIAYGSEIVLRDEPTKEGHTFSGWSKAPATMPAEDIVIEGSFSVNSYTITYKVDGEVYETVTAEYGTAIEPIEEPTKEGHTFSGWSDVPETMPANDITIEGTFSINSYTVTFMIDGEVYETMSVEFGAEIELPTPPEKEGYVFSGWVGVPGTMPAQDIVIEGEYIVDTTGINDVKTENGKVKGVYDLQGRKVDNPANGIYIVNGKKVFVK